jgi:hypothetical protein
MNNNLLMEVGVVSLVGGIISLSYYFTIKNKPKFKLI